jgi:hypothetical protein
MRSLMLPSMVREANMKRAAVFHPDAIIAVIYVSQLRQILRESWDVVPFFQYGQFAFALRAVSADLIVAHWHDENHSPSPSGLRPLGLADCPLIGTFTNTEDKPSEGTFDALLQVPFAADQLAAAIRVAALRWPQTF